MCLSFLNHKPHKKSPPPPPLRVPSRDPLLLSTSSTTTTSSSSTPSSTALSRRSLSILTSSPTIFSPSHLLSTISHLRPFHLSPSSTSFHSSPHLIVLRRLHTPHHHSPPNLRRLLPLLSRSHHLSLVPLLGASLTPDNHHLIIVYRFVRGASLSDCLHNVNNPGFTVLGTWVSRVRIAADVAHGIDYVHNCSGVGLGFVHNRIKSSSIIVTEPDLGAKLCHFGTAQLCGEVGDGDEETPSTRTRSGRFEGTRGYMSPEFKRTGVPTLKSDVFAFGVVLLELVSGEQPLGTWVDEESGIIRTVSLIDTAREVVRGGGSDGLGRLRKWVDRRLRDSYPVDVAERLVKLAVECCDDDPDRRPGMDIVAGVISKLYLESKTWAEGFGARNDITVSLAPR